MASLREMLSLLETSLQSSRFQDYCPNGLQVEGRPDVRRLVTGVTASQALIDAAIEAGADAILVHHGYFWKGEDPVISGMKAKRVKSLLVNDISLLAYHLPLDVHPVMGNNARLADMLGITLTGSLEPANPRAVGGAGTFGRVYSPEELKHHLQQVLGRDCLHIDGGGVEVRTIGLCTGAAQGYIEQAVALGLDAYITGEVSEQTVHIARECGIHFYACGHHATERYGVQAVGDFLARELGIEHRFIDIANPV